MSEDKKTNIDEKITQKLDIMPIESKDDQLAKAKKQEQELEKISKELRDEYLIDDFEFARRNLRRMIIQAETAYEEISGLASDLQEPRAFEVASSCLKAVLDANQMLLNLHKRKAEIEKDTKPKETSPNTGNITVEGNAVFTGTTSDLQKMIEEANKNEQS